jgi:hypothetical protein
LIPWKWQWKAKSDRFHAGRNDKGRNPKGNYNSESAGKIITTTTTTTKKKKVLRYG